MLTEDYCDFETAKLLKDKGFNEKTLAYYECNILCHGEWFEWNKSPMGQISAPTLQMATKWLVQEHRLYVNVTPNVVDFYWTEKWSSYVEVLTKRYPLGKFIGTFNSLEEACEAAIKYCLENLI